MENNPRTNKATSTGLRNRRPTVGCLTSKISDDNGQALWLGLSDVASKRDMNLICFPGGVLTDSRGFQTQANMLYELVNAKNVDGVVSWGTSIGSYTGADGLGAFHERYRPLPVVVMGGTLEGFPSLLIDSYTSMRAAIVHLIEVHGCHRLAFIRGPEDSFHAQERYRAYVETLEAYGLPIDPNLITRPLLWGHAAGTEAMRLLLDERRLRPHTDFEAVVGASIELVLGALEVLQARGVRVPEDVAAVGFDSSLEGTVHTPPLTSVASPHYEMGHQAAEMLLSLMEGGQVTAETLVPELVIRQSCGCLDPAIVQAAVVGEKARGETFESLLASRREQVCSAMAQAVGESSKNGASDWGERLLEGFAGELKGGSPGLFLQELGQVLRQAMAAADDVSAWQGAISALRRQTVLYLDGEKLRRAENLWQQARVMIAETAQRAQTYQAFQATRQAQTLRETETALLTTFDVAGLMDVLAQNLPRLGIPSCYLALYEDPQPYRYPQPAPEWSRLMLAYTERGRVELEPGGRRFPSCELAPEGMLPQERRYNLVIEPLYFRDSQIGFVMLEAGPRQGAVYETLRAQISSALQGAMLVQREERRSTQLRTAAEVSRAASSILDLDELMSQSVELIRDRFGLYYAGLFLVDQTGEWTDEPAKWAVLQAGTGEAGHKMLAASHKLEIGGASMIGWCIANRQARIALDVGKEAVRFSNPLLPHTRSELALPLVSRGQVIGAMTVQVDKPAAFTQEDITTLQSLADQLANAIENARLFTEHRQAEEVLAQERNLLRSLLDNLPDYVFAKDTEGRFVVGNTALARHMGAATPDSLIGKTDFDFYPRELAAQFFADEQALLQSGQSMLDHEEATQSPAGNPRWTLTSKVLLRDSEGKVIGLVGASRDVTELKQTQLKLERHALQLRTAAEVSRAASSFLTLDELLPQVVELIRDRFNLYYVGLFLVDETGQHAVLRAGTGTAGQKMIEARHQVDATADGTSMVGWCIANRQARIALDVGKEAVRLANRLLPETRSELALPLMSRGQAIGALTIQSSQEAAFTEEDTVILQTMAGQVANAIENARFLAARQQAETRTQEALHELERLYRATSQEGWQAIRQAAELPTGYLFDRRETRPAEDVWTPQIQQAVEQNALLPPAPFPATTQENQPAEENVAVAPLSVRGQVFGVVGVYDDPQRPLSPDELALVEEITEQGALALESARLFEQAQARAEELAVLNEISRTLSAMLDQDAVIKSLYQNASRLMDTTNFYVALYDPQQDEVSFPFYAEGERVRTLQARRAGQGLTEYVIRTREPLLIEEHVSERLDKLGIQSLGQESQSWLGAPMSVGDQIVGVVAVQSYTTPRLYNKHHRDLLFAIASQAAVVLENTRLFNEARTRAEELAALNELAQTLSTRLELSQVLQETYQGLSRLMDTTNFYIALYDPEKNEVTFPINVTESVLDQQITSLPADQGMTGYIIRNRTSVLVKDSIAEWYKRMGVEAVGEVALSWLGVPLLIGDQILGVMTIQSYTTPGLYDEHDRDLLSAFASQTAIAIQNARLFEQTRAALAEVEATHQRYLREQWKSFLTDVTERAFGYLDGPNGLVRASKESLASDPATAASGLAVPIRLRGEPIGVLEFSDKDAKHTWSEDERDLVEALADQAALALENARLFEETQSRAQREQLINEITARVRASTNIETILRTAAEELSRTLNLPRTRIRLGAGDAKGGSSND